MAADDLLQELILLPEWNGPEDKVSKIYLLVCRIFEGGERGERVGSEMQLVST